MRVGFFLSEALGSLRRNWVMTMAAVITVFISTVILGGVLVLGENLNRGATSLENRVMIEVFIKDETTPQQQQEFQQRVLAMPEVKEVKFVSKDEALRRFQETVGSYVTKNLPTNPLPASFEVFVNDADQVDTVAARFYDDPIVDNTPGTQDGVQYAAKTVRRMLDTIDLVRWGMWAATIVFAVAAVLLISTTVRLSIFARRREVEIMRLVGATNWFIRWPFVIEGFITGLIGAILGALSVYVVNWAVADWLRNSVDYLEAYVYPLWWQGEGWPLGLLPTLAVLGGVLGAVGGMVALRRYLRT
ncbi:MAG TPA: permease-like cell division protein FtsX [Thermoleophilia bacterium]|nr:permease-like cell division protein FtsX [Thermoleophilia bacterium]HQG03658.1 permease-like cell division protein FtsX [Thermoleophilia bacterium]HQG55246.1 permease-like cell division protein FtsX [Thermoleophilia bacterium]HQJ98217.1 permease-like cell division protein FtsX [Thermoleophilia bacterium]